MKMERCDCDTKNCNLPAELKPACQLLTGVLLTLVDNDENNPEKKSLLRDLRDLLMQFSVCASMDIDSPIGTLKHFAAVMSAMRDRAMRDGEDLIEKTEAAATSAAPTVPEPRFDAVRAEAVLRTWNPTTATKH